MGGDDNKVLLAFVPGDNKEMLGARDVSINRHYVVQESVPLRLWHGM